MATLEEITTQVRGAVEAERGLGLTLKFDFRGAGFIHIADAAVTNDDLPADCTIQVSQDDFEDLARGRLDPAQAMMRGRLKVRGDLSAAMKLRPIFARTRG
ncbi:MAG TPA: SCP2 sterol-binding domain-containing protein [Caulobacteraceae bacterium]|nr:SCP2 sterol-binding domain-containing protein [Caulobacteraceae bacterium]